MDYSYHLMGRINYTLALISLIMGDWQPFLDLSYECLVDGCLLAWVQRGRTPCENSRGAHILLYNSRTVIDSEKLQLT